MKKNMKKVIGFFGLIGFLVGASYVLGGNDLEAEKEKYEYDVEITSHKVLSVEKVVDQNYEIVFEDKGKKETLTFYGYHLDTEEPSEVKVQRNNYYVDDENVHGYYYLVKK